MLTYEEAQKLLSVRSSRKLARNTYLTQEGEQMVVKFWDTPIITIDAENRYTLTSGGYRTLTTKDRLNRFASCAEIWQERNIWYVSTGSRWQGNFKSVLFADGMVVDQAGRVLSGAGVETLPMVMRKVDKLVKKFIDGYIASVMANGLTKDTAGDCIMCQFTAVDGTPEGMGYDHYLMHFEEEYFVPSILIKAVLDVGYNSPAVIWEMMGWDIKAGKEPWAMRHALRRFFKSRKQGIADELTRQAT